MYSLISEIDQVTFDTILIGSSLSNCITFAALSRAGKHVLLLDPQGIHGYTNSTLTLHDYHTMVNNLQLNMGCGGTDDPLYVDLLADLAEERLTRPPLNKISKVDPIPSSPPTSETLYDLIGKAIFRSSNYIQYQAAQKASRLAEIEKKKANGEILDQIESQLHHGAGAYVSNEELHLITDSSLFIQETNTQNTTQSHYLVFPTAQLISQNASQCASPAETAQSEQFTITHNTSTFTLLPSFTCRQAPFPLHNGFEYISSSHKPLSTILQILQKNPEAAGPETLAQLQALKTLIFKHGYRYSIDLIPHAIYSRSLTVKTLLYAKIHECVEFRAVNRILLLLMQSQGGNNGTYFPWEIPSSKNEIFVDPVLSIKSKHRLTTLFLIILNDPSNTQTTSYHLDTFKQYENLSLYHLLYALYINKTDFNGVIPRLLAADIVTNEAILKAFNNDNDLLLLIQLLLLGICQFLPASLGQQGSAALTLTLSDISAHLKQHLYSIGKYTKSPLLYPLYGIGELSQAWIRNGCVWGGVAVIRTDISGIILPQLTDKINRHQKLYVLLSSGQVLATRNIVMDRYLSPILSSALGDTNINVSLKYVHKDYSTLYSPDYTPNTTETQCDKHLTSDTHPCDITSVVGSNIIVTQHITLVVNKLPSYLTKGFEENPDAVSIQIFQLGERDTSKKCDENAILPSKYITIDGTNGMTANGHFLVYITTTLSATQIPPNHQDVVTTQFIQQTQQVTAHFAEKHANLESLSVLHTLPQLHPLMASMSDESVDILYIGTYCQTNQVPSIPTLPDDILNLFTLNPYSVLCHPAVRINDGEEMVCKQVSITMDPNPSITSPDNYIIHSQAVYYNIMEAMYQQDVAIGEKEQTNPKQYLKYPILPFLMTQTDNVIIDEGTGEVLQKLEQRNPQLAHAIDVIDQLESQLDDIEAYETKQLEKTAEKTTEVNILQNDSDNEEDTVFVPHYEKDDDVDEIAISQQEDPVGIDKKTKSSDDDILSTLNNLDLSELENLGL